MEVYKREGSKYWLVDFVVDGERQRRSTRATTKTKAMEAAAEIIQQAQRGDTPSRKGPAPRLVTFAEETFLPFVEASQLDPDTKRYYQNGWRLLKNTPIAGQWIDRITTSDSEILRLPGSGSNANCALRTLRRMLSLAKEKSLVAAAPTIKLREENERSAVFTPEQEQAFLAVAPQPLKDVFLVSQDTGLRPDEAVRMRVDNILWEKNLIFNPDGKTKKSRRYVPLSERVRTLLRTRIEGSTSPWVFPSPRKKGAPMSYFMFAKDFVGTRKAAGLPDSLVLYSARHSFATDLLDRTGNISRCRKCSGTSQ